MKALILGDRLPSAKAIRDVLAVHRDQPSIALDFSFPINWQMDETIGETLVNDLKKFGGEWEAMRATKSLGDHLPAKTGLYMFVFRSPVELLKSGVAHRPLWVFYVGRAGGRASNHTLKSRYRGEYSKYVCGDPAQLWIACHLDQRLISVSIRPAGRRLVD